MKKLLGFVVVGLCLAGTAQAQLALEIRTDADEYIVRQPWSLTFVLRNTGSGSVSVAPATMLGQNMEFMVLEITGPAGETETRNLRFAYYDRIFPLNWEGEILPAGAMIRRTIYPYRTQVLPPVRGGFDWTFREPGTYRLRLVYTLPGGFDYRILRQASGGDVRSNEISIEVKPADATAEEILETYWASDEDEWRMILGEGTWWFDAAPSPLRAIVEKYPDHPLTRYVKLNLARALLTQSIDGTNGAGAAEAGRILDELVGTFPERRVEIACYRAMVYAFNQQFDEAANVFVEALQRDPTLVDDVNFVGHWILATDRGHDALRQYEDARLTGNKRLIDARGFERVKDTISNEEGTE